MSGTYRFSLTYSKQNVHFHLHGGVVLESSYNSITPPYLVEELVLPCNMLYIHSDMFIDPLQPHPVVKTIATSSVGYQHLAERLKSNRAIGTNCPRSGWFLMSFRSVLN